MKRMPDAAVGVDVLPQALAMGIGEPYPMGARFDGQGVNFAVFSAHASAVELCLFDSTGGREVARHVLPGRSGDTWHGYLPYGSFGRPGLLYGFRVHGAWSPLDGHRFNPHKLLLDPWAREIVGDFDWDDAHFAAQRSQPLQLDTQDNGATALKARVIDDHFDWGDDRPLHTPQHRTVLYELHVRGFTMLHPGVPAAQRGCYAGLASDAAVAHLRRLGVTAVSLLPVHRFIDEQRLVAMGLRNHWGYNTLGFFCPEPRYAVNPEGRATRDEFRNMVRRLHKAGIEVILDVVYNHTAETDQFGPSLSWRGLDNASWYRLPREQRDTYVNDTGCGNTLNIAHPRVLQMVMDSLRYWALDMHVDGFRFDLATVLGRDEQGFDPAAAFFACVAQDPRLAGIKLIAEPWDIGPGGYQLGRFPADWLEWNDRFRDGMRGWWLQGQGTRGEFVRRLCASSDVFAPRHRAPSASINYVVSHDGFTLLDLLSYNQRHNEANGENNRDGHGHNLSWNCGVEGPTDDAQVMALRHRLQRALLATVMLAQGTPMLAAGDELGHSQGGNNNPYCQDNATTWIDWSNADAALIDYTAQLIEIRQRHLPLGQAWLSGQPGTNGKADVHWMHPLGREMMSADWHDTHSRSLGALLHGSGSDSVLLLLVNPASHDADFVLPEGRWRLLLDSAQALTTNDFNGRCTLPAHSLLLLTADPH
jgi:glycogen debranching enzyme